MVFKFRFQNILQGLLNLKISMVSIRSSWEGLMLTNHHMLFRALSISTFISSGSCVCVCEDLVYSAFPDLLT